MSKLPTNLSRKLFGLFYVVTMTMPKSVNVETLVDFEMCVVGSGVKRDEEWLLGWVERKPASPPVPHQRQ